MDEAFLPLSGVSIKLSLEGTVSPQRKVWTDKDGVFTISDLAPGKYTVRTDFANYNAVEVHGVVVGDREDRHLRRILLAVGSWNRCVVSINSTSHIQHTGLQDIEITGRVPIGRGETAVVDLVVFADKELVPIGPIVRTRRGDSPPQFRWREIFG